MKVFTSLLLSVAVLAATQGFTTAANAAQGSISGPTVTIQWDDAKWYLAPYADCTYLPVTYSIAPATLGADVRILDEFGTRLADEYIRSELFSTEIKTGSLSIMLCNPDDEGRSIPITVQLEERQHSYWGGGDGSTNVFTAAATLQTREKATKSKTIRCVSKSALKKGEYKAKKFKGEWGKKQKCPKGWKKA